MRNQIFDPKAIVLIPDGDENEARVVATTGPTTIVETIHTVKTVGIEHGDNLSMFIVNNETGDVRTKGKSNIYETFPKDEMMEGLYP